MAHTCSLSPQETEERGLRPAGSQDRVADQPGLHSELFPVCSLYLLTKENYQ